MSNDHHSRDENGSDGGGSIDNSDDRPKYAQLRDAIVDRIQSGTWKPGDVIPSEHEIAREFNVSQGTARKAISMVAEMGLLKRRQGSGTRVQEDTPAERYRFFGFYDNNNVRITPASRDVTSTIARANSRERSALDLGNKARVVRICRTRTRNGKPFIAEKVSVPEALFPNLENEPQLPDALYDFYQKTHKVLVTEIRDELNAVAADAPTAKTLGLKVGAPLLKIDRIAYAPKQQPVEWRVWLCHLKNAHYLARTRGR